MDISPPPPAGMHVRPIHETSGSAVAYAARVQSAEKEHARSCDPPAGRHYYTPLRVSKRTPHRDGVGMHARVKASICPKRPMDLKNAHAWGA